MIDKPQFRIYRFLILYLVLLCLACCKPVTPTPTLEPSETHERATNTPPELFIEPSSTPTVMAQVDQEDSLSALGPWLVYLTEDGIVAVNANGTGRTLLGPPPLQSAAALSFDIPNGLSTSGNEFAFRAERADWSGLDLILARLPDGPITAITPLLSTDLEDQRPLGLDLDIENAVFWETDALRWSPDGRHLAFVAALDGPSSDLYVFDLLDGTIRRLTTGENQAATPVWTQDGRWIIHQEVETFGSGAGWSVKTVWAAAVDGNSVYRLYDVPDNTGPEQFIGTTQTGELIVSRFSQNEPTLHIVDVDSGEITVLHVGFPTADIVDFDPVSGAVAYITDGLYLRSPGSSSAEVVTDGFWYNVRWSPGFGRFFAAGDAGVIAFSTTGVIEQIAAVGIDSVPSPDGNWLTISAHHLLLYGHNGDLVREMPEVDYDEVLWRPDSKGLFYLRGDALFYLAIPDGAPLLVESDVMVTYDYPSYKLRNLGWVGNKDVTLSGVWLFENESGGLTFIDIESGQAVVTHDELSSLGGDWIKVQQGRIYYFGGKDIGLVEILMDGELRETGVDISRIIHPAFACLTPDGTRLIWFRYPEDWSLGEFEILESDLEDGSTTPLVTLQAPAELQEMVSMGGVYPNLGFLSPDERYLYYGWHFEGGGMEYVSGSLFSLSRVDLEKLQTRTFVPLTEEIYGKIDAAISADGRTLAYLRPKDMTWDLVVQDVALGNEVVYSLPAETVGAGRLFFSPDGSELALTAAQRDNQILYTEVLVFDLDSGQRRSIYMGFEDDEVKPFLETRAWTQEGWIVLGEGYRMTGAGTWIVRPDGSGLMRVSEMEFLAEIGKYGS
jgi:hypothetical protein